MYQTPTPPYDFFTGQSKLNIKTLPPRKTQIDGWQGFVLLTPDRTKGEVEEGGQEQDPLPRVEEPLSHLRLLLPPRRKPAQEHPIEMTTGTPGVVGTKAKFLAVRAWGLEELHWPAGLG